MVSVGELHDLRAGDSGLRSALRQTLEPRGGDRLLEPWELRG